MKDSQRFPFGLFAAVKYIKANNERFSTRVAGCTDGSKYIKANNERFSTCVARGAGLRVSISRRIMKDSQQERHFNGAGDKYIKANNERFSTVRR